MRTDTGQKKDHLFVIMLVSVLLVLLNIVLTINDASPFKYFM